MILGNVQLNGRTVLAPLAGVTDSTFRLICKQQGAALVFSEMVSADGLVYKDERSLKYLSFHPEERPIGIQIFGSDPIIMAEATKLVQGFGPDFIDLNFGCPVKKVVKRGAGAAILKDITLLRRITSAVTAVSSIPVTAKIRSGWDVGQINAVEVAKILQDCGVCAVTIHPRTQFQLFKGQADWNIIHQVKRAVSIPVIGNGDVRNPNDAKKMLSETGCDLIMIGRAALGNPWIFKQINYYLSNNSQDNTPISNEHRLAMCLQHLHSILEDKGEYRGIREIRKHFAWYLKGLPHSSSLRAALFKLTDIDQVKEKLYQYFNEINGKQYDKIL